MRLYVASSMNLAGTYALYRENKNLIFSIIEETLDEVLPKKVEQSYMQFAETKTFAQGDKPIFKRKRDIVLALSSSSLVLDQQVFTKSLSQVLAKLRASKSELALSAELLRLDSRSSQMVVLTSQKLLRSLWKAWMKSSSKRLVML